MERKRTAGRSATILLIVSVLSAPSLSFAHRSESMNDSKLEQVFFYTAEFILQNEDELALTEDQVKVIKELKLGVEKDLIRHAAEKKLLAADINAKLREDLVDLESTLPLVDQKHEVKKTIEKSLVEDLGRLKATLTEEQRKKLKTLWKKKK